MLTTVTQMVLRDGAEKDWDDAMRQRMQAVQNHPGWMEGQVLKPVGAGPRRIVVGTWRSRADWEDWHRDDTFRSTRDQLDSLETEPRRQWWHEVTVEAHR